MLTVPRGKAWLIALRRSPDFSIRRLVADIDAAENVACGFRGSAFPEHPVGGPPRLTPNRSGMAIDSLLIDR